MTYFLIAGEASGDLHASNLMASLKREDINAEFHFFGGDLMRAVGGRLVKHYRETAFMGVIAVLLHFRTILRNMQTCRDAIRACRPDVVILIDYPGFNLKIAKFVKTQLKIPVYYYISPKIWAWKKYRIRSFRRYVDRMFCILPFEVDFFKSLNYPVDYVGNPSVDSVADFHGKEVAASDDFRKTNGLSEKPVLAILAGSRKAEIKENLPTMLSVAKRFPDFQPVIAGAPGLTPEDYKSVIAATHISTPDFCAARPISAPSPLFSEPVSAVPISPLTGGAEGAVHIVFGQTYHLLSIASCALVTSGTATLEAALFRVPQVVCYYFVGGRITNFIFKHFFHVPYISLVNLIAGNEVVQELFGANFTHQNIHAELARIIHDSAYRSKMMEGYDRVIAAAGKPGASERTAQLIVHALGIGNRYV